MQRSQEAYQAGDKARAHELSVEGKKHGAEMERHNAAARDFIFAANNADQPADTIDLHGLYVDEAKEIVVARIRAAQGRGDAGLHVVVGKGGHSEGGVRKIAPAVVQVCEELGLKWEQEQNGGRIYVWLRPGTGGNGEVPPGWGAGAGKFHGTHPQQQHYQPSQQQQQQQNHQQQYQGGHQQPQYQPQQGQQQQQQQQQQEPAGQLVEKVAKKLLPKIFKCCAIM